MIYRLDINNTNNEDDQQQQQQQQQQMDRRDATYPKKSVIARLRIKRRWKIVNSRNRT